MAKKQPKETTERSFWEDAYDQTVVVAKETDKLTTLLEQNGETDLAEHIFTIFTGLAQAVRMQMAPDVRDRIGERLLAEQEAAFKAALDEFVAGLQADLGADVDLAHEVE